jgi:hypothetical protein
MHAVQWQECSDPQRDVITSTVTVDVDLMVPKWFVLPKVAVHKTGSAIMSAILGAAVPKFLAQLETDYQAWATGDDSRQSLSDGKLL